MASAWSLRFMIMELLYSAKHLVKDGHLHDETILRFVLHEAARAVEDLIGNSGITPHRQAVHQAAVGGCACEPTLAHAPIGERASQVRILCRVPVGIRRAPFLGVQN